MKLFLLSTCLVITFFSIAQSKPDNASQYQIQIKKATGKITIDGILEEPDWKNASSANQFKQNFPYDTSFAGQQTEARVTFDDQFLYVSAICYQPKKYTVQSLRRDYPNSSSDIFFILLDPFRDKLNGFYFSVTPYAVQKEGLLYTSSSGTDNNFDWDNKWYTAATRHEDKYIVELAIPFKTLRFKLNESGTNEWNINFCRYNHTFNERSSWAPIPQNFRMIDLNFNGKLIWNEPPPSPGNNFSVIPFLLGGRSKDFIKNTPANNDIEAGVDAKIGITPSLNLDLTVNPDFAQVEVDQQVTNLSRFELFFPERRQFFLENSDLFGSFGFRNVNPFFSRRIGLGKNVNDGENVRVPIIAGARLSGRINKDWRIGLLNMQTNKSAAFGLPFTNFSVAAIQRRVGIRNNLGAIFVNKEEFKNKTSLTRFHRIAGIDYNLAGKNGKANGKFFMHRNITPQVLKGQYAMGSFLEYNSRKFNYDISLENIGVNYNADVGFVPRNGYLRAEGAESFVFFPKGKISKWVNNWRIGPDFDVYYGKVDKRVTDWDAGLFFRVGFQNAAELSGALLRWDYTYLFDPFDPTNQGCTELQTGTSYTYFSNRFSFTSNTRKKLFYSLNTKFGKYFNGNLKQLQTTWNLRMNTFGILSLLTNYTRIDLPAPYCDADLWLIGTKAELSFSKNVFFNAFFQYNNQSNNFNVNARFQWRFKPVSDFFIVYTDNYFASDNPQTIVNNRHVTAFMPKNRAIVAKLTYWFNL
ncbi:MAG TPA: DUF5916 domain-containing protein [Chitinophagaceae bacterium]|nr:DUF5916 domain-containing protein [Chitinophagaceae bacterium]